MTENEDKLAQLEQKIGMLENKVSQLEYYKASIEKLIKDQAVKIECLQAKLAQQDYSAEQQILAVSSKNPASYKKAKRYG